MKKVGADLGSVGGALWAEGEDFRYQLAGTKPDGFLFGFEELYQFVEQKADESFARIDFFVAGRRVFFSDGCLWGNGYSEFGYELD